ncbi:MAG: cytochrome b/b6 domain-containing protein [Salaquimonas sp.]
MTNMSNQETGRDLRPDSVKVWDPFVRIFHWSLLGLFVFAYFTGDEWDKAHELAGYIIAGLIALRIGWGIIGSKHARFSDFVYRPTTVLAFVRDSIALKAKRYIGHNPAGGAMVIALMLAIIAISISGYMMTTDMYWGTQWVEDVHEISVNGTLVLVGLHVAGVVLASFEHKENLVKSMFTGRKRRN